MTIWKRGIGPLAATALTIYAGAVSAQSTGSCVAANQEFQLGFSLKTSGNQVQCQLVDDTPQWIKKVDDVPIVTLCLSSNSFYSVGALLSVDGRFIRCNTAGTWEVE